VEMKIFLSAPAPAPAPNNFMRYLENYLLDLRTSTFFTCFTVI
jgi:hypothetical protein